MNEQRSQLWREARAGRITASRFGDVMTPSGRQTSARMQYMRELAFERLANTPKHEVNSKTLRWGTEVEAFAREAYELRTGVIITSTGFIEHPVYPFIGASPDGLIEADGMAEVKCPMAEAVHIATWLDGMPLEHMPQVQGTLLVTGRSWCDFVSYDPRQSEPYRLYVQRIARDDTYIAKLAGTLLQFEDELQAMVRSIERKAESQS